MRREGTSGQRYIDWLKSIGCIFYCAFDGDTGMFDLINNKPFITSGYGSIAYDSNKNMYQITTPSGQGQDIGYWDNGIGKNSFPESDYTVIGEMQRITTTSGKSIHGITPYSNNFRTCQSLGLMYDGTANVVSWPSGLVKAATSFSTTLGWRKYYQQGTLYANVSIFAQYQPMNWVTLGDSLRLARTPVDSNSTHRGVSLYIGSIMLFNKALDEQTIYKIEGYA